jgi:hypothetical protein
LEQDLGEGDAGQDMELKKEELDYQQILQNYPGLESYIPYRSKESIQ